MVGTSTSGQAARTLGTEAGIDASRTLRSLLWRVDHGRIELDRGTVVVHDEAGMASDTDVLRLLVAAELAGAKVVMVGDDRQLGAVGPGGALRALLERHRPAVHILKDNIRQDDPNERRALADLRAGDVQRAVAWYADEGRIVTASTRTEALDAVVNAWATDFGVGRESAMYAWRRANVEELNRRARARMAADGRLSGPELTAPGGRRYAAGDCIVTLAPGADGRLVTSERGRVLAVDPGAGTLTACMDDGRIQPFAPEETTADRLALGYAVTDPPLPRRHRGHRPPLRRRRRPGTRLRGHEPGPARIPRLRRRRQPRPSRRRPRPGLVSRMQTPLGHRHRHPRRRVSPEPRPLPTPVGLDPAPGPPPGGARRGGQRHTTRRRPAFAQRRVPAR